MSNHIVFRAAADLATAITARASATSPSLTAQRDLERYYALLAAELRTVTLSPNEAQLLVDANNGTLWEPHTMRLLWAGVDDAILLDGLAAKWQVNGKELVATLRLLTPGQTVAVVDAVERTWSALTADPDRLMADTLRHIGLVR